MTFSITRDCIDCMACFQACSFSAVVLSSKVGDFPLVKIDPKECTHCWPFYQRPQCIQICPVGAISVEPSEPVPHIAAIRRMLGLSLRIAGPYSTAKIVVQLRTWVRDWFLVAVRTDSTSHINVDKILDFDSRLRLLAAEFLPDLVQDSADPEHSGSQDLVGERRPGASRENLAPPL